MRHPVVKMLSFYMNLKGRIRIEFSIIMGLALVENSKLSICNLENSVLGFCDYTFYKF